MARAYVIANPKAGKGAVGDGWERLLKRLHDAGLEPIGDLTQGPAHAVELARDARRKGEELVVAAGGDGTVHEVVNGLLAEGPGPDVPALGVIPAGSGCDYVKTFDIPMDTDAAIERIASSSARSVDVGEVTFSEGKRLFANIAEVGFGPRVVARAARLPRALGGAVYLAAFWLELPRYRRRPATITADNETFDGRLMNLVVANGRVFGGGMRVAPEADPSDGRFDVQFQTGSKLDYVRGIPKVYKGTHLPHPNIREVRATTVGVTTDEPALVEADGEVLGHTPATFRILPGALRLRA